MSYTNETTYYGLPLPTGSDKSTFTDNNTAFQAVDAALHTAYEQSGAATEDIVAIKATVANLIQADIDFQNDLDTEKGKIRNLQDKEVLQDAEIAAVKADAQDMITAYNEPTATSTHAYSVGDFFIYNDVLYRATDTIAIGDTIVPDTNCTTTNVSTELLQVKSNLANDEGNITTLLARLEVKSQYSASNIVDATSNIAFPALRDHAIVGFKSAGNMLATWGSENGLPYVHLTNYLGQAIAEGTDVGAITIYYI